jgi:hypothetical protein
VAAEENDEVMAAEENDEVVAAEENDEVVAAEENDDIVAGQEQEFTNNNTNNFNNPHPRAEDPTPGQLQQTPTQSPFMGTNTPPTRPNNLWGPAFLKILGMQDQPDIDLMKAIRSKYIDSSILLVSVNSLFI